MGSSVSKRHRTVAVVAVEEMNSGDGGASGRAEMAKWWSESVIDENSTFGQNTNIIYLEISAIDTVAFTSIDYVDLF